MHQIMKMYIFNIWIFLAILSVTILLYFPVNYTKKNENIQLKNISSRRIETLIASSLKMNTGRWLATMISLGMIRLVCILNIFLQIR